jgi:hypothetical protein
VSRVAPDATAFPIRQHQFDLVVLSLWENPNDDMAQISWTRRFYQAMQPWSAAMVYVNALSDVDGGRVAEAYGVNYERLADVKAIYDPRNMFRRNQNVPPSRRESVVQLPREREREAPASAPPG